MNRSRAVGPTATAGYPFLAPLHLVALVVLEVGVGLALSRYGVRFDGFMDVHRTALAEPVPARLAVLDQIASCILPLLIALGLVRTWSVSPTGVAGAVIAAATRLPILVVGAVILWMPLPATLAASLLTAPTSLQPAIVIPALVTVACVVAGIAFLVVGIRRATGARGGVLVLRSIGIFVLAELAGKLLLAVAG